MKKFTDNEMQFLAKFEDNFNRAIDSDYVRGAALSDMDNMVKAWERVTDKPFHLNKSCGHCILSFFKQIGGAYRKQKADAEKKAKAETEEK